jgi:2,4-dienoyl-CoA reductase-like NADH-dependent reductase (Old Yellow Enzyme family)
MDKIETFFLKVIHPFLLDGAIAKRDSVVEMLERDASHVIGIGRARLATDDEVKNAQADGNGAKSSDEPSAQDKESNGDSKAAK